MKIVTDITRTNLRENDFVRAGIKNRVAEAHTKLRDVDAKNENVWVDLPNIIDDKEIGRINSAAQWVRENSDVLCVIGVGGSYAGAFAGLQLLDCAPESLPIEFLGTSFDATPIIHFLHRYKDKRISVNIVSKSGTTLEITAAFNIVDRMMREKYPNEEEYRKRVIVTTRDNYGTMHNFAVAKKVTFFTMLDGVGGRYSVLSAVGYLPLAVAGIDIKKIHDGAKQAYIDFGNPDITKNEAYKYAAARYLLHTDAGKTMEVMASFYEGLEAMGKWWQQLFGESEGKDGKGIAVTPLIFSRDLHSMGQYIQQGNPLLFETIINADMALSDIELDEGHEFFPTSAESLAQINRAAFNGTVKAHADAGVPVVIINIERLDEAGFGYLVYFFEIACAMSAFLLGVNPFDQPGVEFYKRNMREELSKKAK